MPSLKGKGSGCHEVKIFDKILNTKKTASEATRNDTLKIFWLWAQIFFLSPHRGLDSSRHH